jgi:hypothetical protein
VAISLLNNSFEFKPPFYSRDTPEMYNNILYKPLRINPNTNISSSAKNIIEAVIKFNCTRVELPWESQFRD